MQSAERIRAMILFDGVSDDYSTDDGTESDENFVKPRESDTVVCRKRYVE